MKFSGLRRLQKLNPIPTSVKIGAKVTGDYFNMYRECSPLWTFHFFSLFLIYPVFIILFFISVSPKVNDASEMKGNCKEVRI